MSSPISSLKKGKRTPLDPRQAQVPFRNLEHTSVELPSGSLKKDGFSKVPKSSSSTNAPSDRDLLSSMMSRLAQVEQQLKAAQTQIGEKDKKIRILEEKAKLLEKARGYNSGTITELEKKCRRLQTQVFQMEEFLADYGMVWVGDDASDSDYEVLEEPSSTAAPSSISRQGVWNPTPRDFQMDFDVVTKNIRELNVLAGEGCSDVSRTKDGARLKVRESVPLVLYSNGILMFGGPFRPYSDPITQQCLQDIMDGYFPSELQSRYPGGVPFEVQDKRDIVFEDRRTALLFPGTGQSLAAEENAKSLKVESHTPEHKNSAIQLANISLLRTVENLKTYILKMKFTDCIRDVRSHVDAARPKDAPPYDIKTSFPNRVYDDPNATLQECGLVPNATLHLLVKKV
ncbi:UBX domain-containing protein 11 [Stylophora pistillata]|uniref:UBX domain-containing protein 11 n=1 Tax=Stylophora pistillata TaxID=50429 RepID=A0A2B4SDN6_STYPI|nr:UBX domain-containing protein 11 [Stylophora pistillata]